MMKPEFHCMIYVDIMKIHQLKDERYSSNVYLIDAEQPTLIDTGGDLREKILAWVPEILGDRKLSQIIFTHGHGDHVNSAVELAAHFGVPFYIHPADSELLPEASPLGSEVDVGDRQFSMIHTPGHSHGCVCLYEPNDKILISGDTIFPGGRTGRWDLKTAHYPDLVQSVENLLELDVQSLYPGHYDPLYNGVMEHIKASLETLKIVGEKFDDAKYDARVTELRSILP